MHDEKADVFVRLHGYKSSLWYRVLDAKWGHRTLAPKQKLAVTVTYFCRYLSSAEFH